MLAPKVLPTLRRRMAPLHESRAAAGRQRAPRACTQSDCKAQPAAALAPCLSLLPALGIKQAIAKTVTFRVIVTVLDFTSNYVVIGEFNAAAGLSTFALVVGPVVLSGARNRLELSWPLPMAISISLRSCRSARMRGTRMASAA